ncbi:MAG: hypothetical protein KJT03_06695, partial [Verrucomicrobiae bacterium]|nr:hypothetical protein [Verrucomicrobiae bacterium]
SPSLTWDNRVLLDLERKFHASNRILPVYLYVAAGSLEELPQDPMVSNLKAFIRQLETRDYDRFNLAYQINKNDDHLTNKYVTYTRGVRWVFHEMDSDGSSANALPSEVWRQYLVPFLIIVAVAAVALAGLWQARGLLGKSNS